VIDWIHCLHSSNLCPATGEVKLHAQKLQENRKSAFVCFAGGWWQSLMRKHGAEIEAKICSSKNDRPTATSAKVASFVAELSTVLKSLKTPRQISNMDETGSTVRPEKTRQKLGLSLKQTTNQGVAKLCLTPWRTPKNSSKHEQPRKSRPNYYCEPFLVCGRLRQSSRCNTFDLSHATLR
jgi:hypothetical protein